MQTSDFKDKFDYIQSNLSLKHLFLKITCVKRPPFQGPKSAIHKSAIL